jgi:beta-glucanase (GH16 family)
MANSVAPSISDKYSLSPDPARWGADVDPNHPEPDDFLHNPDPKRDRKNDGGGSFFTGRGIANLGCLFILGTGIIALFAGYPLYGYFTRPKTTTLGAFNLGGTNATGQVPVMEGGFALIDADTPLEARHKIVSTGEKWDLVFSDEFNVDGRTFYPGDDPFWEANDLHYWGTNNLEWYDPGQVTTVGGAMKITLAKKRNHDLNYIGGLVTSWNKFCFTGGLLEAAVTLPGRPDVEGIWPAVWTMGNLGRAGFGASLEGLWPYSYDACDVGTMANQTRRNQPLATLTGGVLDENTGIRAPLSFLPGQRLSACTCPGEPHPGPIRPDGTFVGRAAPEIDVLEAQVQAGVGHVSQSCQWAPFDYHYEWKYEGNLIINDPTISELNSYKGGVFQEASSVVSTTNQGCYDQVPNPCFSVFGFEYRPGNAAAGGYITWINDNKPAWTLNAAGMAADDVVKISERIIPAEPLYLILNVGISENFGAISPLLTFPVSMYVDYIRIYQSPDAYNVGCSPPDFPTAKYIDTYIEAYTNPNLTTWSQYGQPFPKNRFAGEC